ncbi:MAG: hypothetical protein AAF655_04080 [Bacteroidota bacterium]
MSGKGEEVGGKGKPSSNHGVQITQLAISIHDSFVLITAEGVKEGGGQRFLQTAYPTIILAFILFSA